MDATITNILEGRVMFTPDQSAPATSGNPQPSTSITLSTNLSGPSSSSSSANDRDLFNTAATTFAKSAQERSKSFQERKDQLIANARRRFFEKHNLNIAS